jgi:hypothetical protein
VGRERLHTVLRRLPPSRRACLRPGLPTDGTYVHDLLPRIAIVSVGMGLTFVPLTLLATTNVRSEDAGLASGLFNTSQQVGGALGLAILSTLAASHTKNLLSDGVARPDAIVRGYHVAFFVGALMLVGALVLIVLTIRKQDVRAIDTGGVELDTAVA